MNLEKEVEPKKSQRLWNGTPGRVAKGFLGIVISAAFVVLIIKGVEWDQLRERLSSMDMGVVPGILVSLTGMFLLKAIRWQYLMASLKRIPFCRVLNLTMIGFAANNVLPLRAGDLVRAHLLGKYERITTTAVLATVVLDRIIEALPLLTVSIAVLAIVPVPAWIYKPLLILAGGVGAVIGVVLALRYPPGMIWKWWEFFRGSLPERLENLLTKSIKEIRSGLETGKGKLRLINLYILALVEYAFCGMLIYLSLKGVGIDLSLATVMCVLISTSFSVLIPAAPGNIGVFEFAVMGVLDIFKIDKTIALSGAIILHAITILPACLVGFGLMVRDWIRS